MSDKTDQNIRLLEAILFASSSPVTEKALARRLPDGIEVTPLLAELKLHYEDRGVNLVQAGGSWAFRSARDLSNLLNVSGFCHLRMNRNRLNQFAIESTMRKKIK